MQTVGGRYVLDGRLGEGGMGQVYRAKHVQLGKAFALKMIAPAFADDGAARARFIQEAKLASEISHPNIVSVVDYGEDAEFGAYMVMELVDGEPLLADSSARPSLRFAMDVLAQVADALDCIHKRGIVHGDVKADNILLTAEPATAAATRRRRIVRLVDFGLAHRHGAHQDGVSGTPHYLAPERCAGGAATIASDIYALGVLSYLLFTNTLPFDGDVMDILMAHIQDDVEPIGLRRAEPVDQAVEALVARAMAKEPEDRHASAAAFRYELNTVMDMLDMGRRRVKSGPIRVENPREVSIVQAFERSRIPQALLSVDGVIVAANKGFAKLVGRDDFSQLDGVALAETALATFVPGLARALRGVHSEGKATERRASVYRGADKPALELVLWISPLPIPGMELHLLVRVIEADKR